VSGVTDLPFAALPKQLGAGMVVSEMIASWAMIRENQKTAGNGGNRRVRRRVGGAACGCDPGAMAEGRAAAVDKGAPSDRHQISAVR